MSRRSPQDVWTQLAAEAGEEEIERAASVTVAQAETDLRKAGFDVKAERAKASALMKDLLGEGATDDPASKREADDPAVEPTAWVSGAPTQAATVRPFHRRYAVLLAAALVAAAIGGGAIALGIFNKPTPPIDNRPDAAPSATVKPAPAPSAQEPTYRRVPADHDDKPHKP